ncbi:hypothetical protein [Streptomyces olindensis]|uniref:hypothetical protein n=1 Tax=Streptomyces olindensis TaxID=358823 RepID=UPI00364DB170
MRGTARRARAAGLVVGAPVAGTTACTGNTDGDGTDRVTPRAAGELHQYAGGGSPRQGPGTDAEHLGTRT